MSKSTSVKIHLNALDAMQGAHSRHYFFDAEPADGCALVVMRGDDATKAGSKAKTREPELKWNDAAANAIAFTLATVTGAEAMARAEQLAGQLRQFFGAEGKLFSERAAALDADGFALVAMVGIVEGTAPHANEKAGWRVCRFADSREQKRAQRVVHDRASAVATVIAAAEKDPTALAKDITPAQLAALKALIASSESRSKVA